MSTEAIIERGRRYLFQNYRQPDFVLVEGAGSRVTDAAGKTYLDLIAGLATCGLGHCHPAVTDALREQAGRLVHVSNLYWNERQVDLAERLCESSFADRVFLCNSGTEANEAAIKLARRHHHDRGDRARRGIVSFEGSFHGRTLGALAATGQPKYHEGFGPMPGGFVHVPFGDAPALDAAVDETTAAVIVEPIQGEAGVVVPPPGFLGEIARLCKERGALLVLDEVQSGMGRTGRLWCHEWEGVTPDVMTSAKALGNGVPIGAVLAREEVAEAFVPGTHASTFGGNPLASAAALATLDTLLRGALSEGEKNAAHLWSRLESRIVGTGRAKGVRGRGMWIALTVSGEARALAAAAAEAGVLVNAIGETVIRLAPSLLLGPDEADEAVDLLTRAWPDR